ncbi:thioredoxin domain-containing protein [Bythopirellula polymerisocia]|uniref:Disulfide bond formation protein D n=1 Tax=Bythopirellula polymerisocia TaxID=2528003 RepID=A0A5C6CV84_9BACT|nr:thioredoxin domain-containing protein [Bythopirellula polymerisocia]TWU28462.1 Disulfide bond formation protein D precursor [Bythopirellula polymerisocia]
MVLTAELTQGSLSDTPQSRSRGLVRGFTLVLPLAVALVATLLMSLAQLETIELPGCGLVSDCSQAAASHWGKVPGTEWPLSFVGFAYFQSLAAALLVGGGRLPGLLRVVLMLGAGASLLLIGVMLVSDYLCGYCLVIHTANLLLVGCYEVRQWRTPPGNRASNQFATFACFAATFASTSLLLAWLDQQSHEAAGQVTRSQLEVALSQSSNATDETTRFAPGRYVLGPRDAKVHVTVVSDYQCPSCRHIDATLLAMTAGRDEVSISVRHFPFCTDCNDHVDKTRHPNACRAAIAAEVAGIAGGPEAFWQMHDWLFEHRGDFTDAELVEFTNQIKLDQSAFQAALSSEVAIANVRADTEAADAAGLKFTPMVFINGVAMKIDK